MQYIISGTPCFALSEDFNSLFLELYFSLYCLPTNEEARKNKGTAVRPHPARLIS